MTIAKIKARWFFPVRTEEDAIKAIKIAYKAIVTFAVIQALILTGYMLYIGTLNKNILDPAFMLGLAWALRARKSRTVAVVLITYSVVIAFVTLAASVDLPLTEFGGRNLIVAIIFIYASYKGVQGTFAYHRLTNAKVRVNNVLILCAAIIGYIAFSTFLTSVIYLAPALETYASTLPENSLVFIWLVFSVVFVFFGGLRKLPGTKHLNTLTPGSHDLQPKMSRHYIARHWRGELSLFISYWVNTVLIGIIIVAAFLMLKKSGIFQRNLLIGTQAAVTLMVLSIPVYIWQLGGCWRSANRRAKETGKQLWARVAQAALIIGAVQTSTQWLNTAPAFVEVIKVATRTEEYKEYTVKISENSDEIEITGYMGIGVDNALKRLLAEAPNVWVVHLNSPGGRLGPARKVRDLIEERGLHTHTSTECNSACLIPFMAGRNRIIYIDARLGFHSYGFPGLTQRQTMFEVEVDKRYFATVGVDTEFLDKAFSVSSDYIWFPDIDELIESKVITHTFDGTKITSYVEE